MLAVDFNHTLLKSAAFLKPFAINLTKDDDDAQDIFRDTLYKALTNRNNYSDGTNIKGWLFTIMRNIFINEYRRKSRNKIIFDSSKTNYLLNNNLATSKNNVEEKMRLKELMHTIFKLPNIFKTPFQLYFSFLIASAPVINCTYLLNSALLKSCKIMLVCSIALKLLPKLLAIDSNISNL